jgi:hypothetical protein
MNRATCFLFPLASLFLLTGAPFVTAGHLLVSGTNYYEGISGYGYGQSNSLLLTSSLDAGTGNNVTLVTDFANTAQVQAADALWLDIRQPANSLTVTEQTNLTNFISTGRRVVLIGENNSWTNWNNQILGLVGGSYSGGTGFDAIPIVSNELTTGISKVQFQSAGTITGGTALFSPASAALFGPQNNVLVILDSNILADFFRTSSNFDTDRFVNNVATWVTTPIPEPTAFTVLLLPFALLLSYRLLKKMPVEKCTLH